MTITSEEIGAGYALHFCELTAGPLDSADGFEASYLATDACDVSWLGSSAKVLRIPGWIASRLAKQGFSEPVATRALDGFYWVCGMGGGVQSTHDLVRGKWTQDPIASITLGPFSTREEAEHAFDVLWESPD